jgi:hypothetical protein
MKPSLVNVVGWAVVITVAGCNFGVFAGNVNPAETVCACTCDTGDERDSCFVTCKEPFDAEVKNAHDAGCDDALAAYSKCLIDQGECLDRSFDAPACGTKFSLLNDCEESASG